MGGYGLKSPFWINLKLTYMYKLRIQWIFEILGLPNRGDLLYHEVNIIHIYSRSVFFFFFFFFFGGGGG